MDRRKGAPREVAAAAPWWPRCSLLPNCFYDIVPVLKAEAKARARLALCRLTADTLGLGLGLFGICPLEWDVIRSNRRASAVAVVTVQDFVVNLRQVVMGRWPDVVLVPAP